MHDLFRRTTGWLARPAGTTFAVAMLYLAIAVALTVPLSIHPGSVSVPAASDTYLYAWTLAWDAHAFLHHPLSIFDANIFFPYHRTLAYSENLIGSALLVAPIEWITGNPLLALNLAALASIPLCALGAFVLARRLRIGVPASVICGLVYGFAPPRFLRFDQAHLTAVQWIPFCLAYVHTWLDTGRPMDLRIALIFLTLQVLTSGHGAVFLLFAIAALTLYRLATGTRVPFERVARDIGLPGLVILIPAVLTLVPYRRVQLDVGLRRDLGDWTGAFSSFLSSPTHVHTFILEKLGLQSWVEATAQASLFPGYLVLLLTLIALWPRRRAVVESPPSHRWRPVGALLEGAGIAAVLVGVFATRSGIRAVRVADITISLRHIWRVWAAVAVFAALRLLIARPVPFDLHRRLVSFSRWRTTLHDDMRTFYLLIVCACVLLAIGPPYGPWRFLYWLPGLSFIRVPSRFMILGILGLAVLTAYGFERLTARVGPGTCRAIALAVGLGILVESAAVPFEVVPNPMQIPAIDRWLDTRPKPFVVAEVPPVDSAIFMIHSMAHWQRTVHGYSGWVPAETQEFQTLLEAFPEPASVDRLVALGVTYVVVHTELYPLGQWPNVAAQIARETDRLRLIRVEGNGRAFEITAGAHADGQGTTSPPETSTRTWQPSSR